MESAAPVQVRPLRLGSRLSVWPPVMLAPMAGVTNHAYRKICTDFGAGLCTSEMVSARGIVQGGRRTWEVAHFAPEERPRSVQIFGSDPAVMAEATRMLVDALQVDHVDINFGCPVPKVLQQGAGAAAALEIPRYRRILREVVRAASPIPVSVKLRLGMDEERFTFREAARAAEEEGCSMITLHARTAAQMYSGRSRWEFVAELKTLVGIPVVGNGDIRTVGDCLRRFREAGCDGVAIGRGCLGNPWLFRDIRRALEGQDVGPPPSPEEIVAVVREHYLLLERQFSEFPVRAALYMRRLGAWYARGLRGAASLRREFQAVSSRADFEKVVDRLLACARR